MTAAHDDAVRLLVVAGALALGRLAPRGDRMTAARGLAFTTAERMVDRVHRDAAVMRLPAQPAHAAGLAVVDVLVVRVRDRADGGDALGAHHAQLARREAQLGVARVLADQLRIA